MNKLDRARATRLEEVDSKSARVLQFFTQLQSHRQSTLRTQDEPKSVKSLDKVLREFRKFGNNGRDPANLFQRSEVYRASGPTVGNRKCASGSCPPTLRNGDFGMPLSLSWMPHVSVGAAPLGSSRGQAVLSFSWTATTGSQEVCHGKAEQQQRHGQFRICWQ